MDAEWSSLRAMKHGRRTRSVNGLMRARKLDALGPEIMSAWYSESALKRVLSCQGETPAENSKDSASFEAMPSEMRTTTLRYSRIWDHRQQACRRPKSLTLLPGCCTMQADAIRAYRQALLVGVPTWVRLPRDRWPAAWNKMHDPVVQLCLALYRHPDAGTCWEKHCDAKLGEKGFSPVIG